FVQGLVAKKFPGMLQGLLAQGHEIQSHGHTHRPLFGMDRRTLRVELENAREAVRDACGVEVTSFRAPDFSILQENIWALEVLADCGFEVDSSIFPMQMKRYGIARQSIQPCQYDLPGGAKILEAPVAVWKFGNTKVPVAGGGYFRLLPRFILEN